MRKSKVIPEDAQAEYWRVVRQCLKQFHQAKPHVYKRLKKLRERVESSPKGEFELFFHAEPWDIACAVARNDISVLPVLQEYLAIRDASDHETAG